jgi:DNA-binding FadR family transcriptional regulator
MRREIEIQQGANLTDVEFCATDVRFHRAIVDAAGNPLFGFLMTSLVEALQPVSNLVVFRFRERQEIVRHHRNICAALERGDADEAGAALIEQMTYLRERFERAQEWREAKDRAARSLETRDRTA